VLLARHAERVILEQMEKAIKANGGPLERCEIVVHHCHILLGATWVVRLSMSVVTVFSARKPAPFWAVGEKIRKAKKAFKSTEKTCPD